MLFRLFQKAKYRDLVSKLGTPIFPQKPSLKSVGSFPEQEEKITHAQEVAIQDIKKRSVNGAASYFLRTVLLQVIGLVATSLLGFYLSPEDYGIYGLVIQVVGLLTFFSDIGLAAALIQKKTTPTKREYRTAFTVQQLLSWLIFGITILVATTAAFQMKAGNAGIWILLAMGLSFPLATLKTIPSVILERKLDFSKLVLPQILEQIVFQGTLIFMVIRGYGLISYAYAIIFRSVVGAISMSVLQPWSFGIMIHVPALKGLFGYGAKFQINDFLARIKDQLFYFFLAAFLPSKEFGYITWAKQWSMYPYSLTVQNVMSVTFPAFSRLQGHKVALRKAIEKSLFFITTAIFPILIGMVTFIIPALTIIPEYQKWQPAAFSLIFFTLSIGWSAVSTPLTNTLNAVGQINTTLKLMIFWTILTWVLTPVLIVFYGYNGVALAALAISFTSALPVYYVRKIVPINFIESVWRQAVAAIVMAFVGFLGRDYWGLGFGHLLLGGVITGSSYILALVLVGRDKLMVELKSLR